ncbi:hypothetical protein N7501_004224 [Penicillium viridicatum]|nr:hypothetical protein N7501_004224 [Penicillium viridicatum]
MGNPVIVWADGIPFIPVFADYHALVGSHLRKYIWLITKKMSRAKLNHEGWHLGEIVVSLKRLRPPADVTLAFNVDFDSYGWSKFTQIPTFNCATRQQELISQDRELLSFKGSTFKSKNSKHRK